MNDKTLSDKTADILVVGTGPVGMASALLAAHAGFSVVLVGPAPNVEDRRTTAVMMPGLRLLAPFELLEAVRADSAPLKTMRIIDGSNHLVRSPTVTFRAEEIGEEAFGYNIPNRVLNRTLMDRVAGAPITWHQGMIDAWEFGADAVRVQCGGDSFAARLAVAADGRNSPAREAAGIAVNQHPYPQTAIVCEFSHSRPHQHVSTEFHTETGPLTLVPLPGMRSSLVWVVDPRHVGELMALDDEAFARRLEDRVQSMLGAIAVEGERQTWPMTTITARRFSTARLALVGEAAHVFPPIGAQGLNLGLRDVRNLIDVISASPADPGAVSVMERYDRERRPDILQRTGAVHALNMSLLTGFLPVQMLKAAGLQALASFAPLRNAAMAEGLVPGEGLRTLASMFSRRGTDRRAADPRS